MPGMKQSFAYMRGVLAGLGSEAEGAGQEARTHLGQSRTTSGIAQRLHAILTSGGSLVREAGEIVGRGRHADLLRRNGRYASFFRLPQRGPPALASVSATA